MDSVGYVSVYSAWGHIWMLTFKIMQSRTNPQPTSERIYILYIKSLSKAACHTLNIAKVHNYLAKGVIFFITKGAPSKFYQLPHASAAIEWLRIIACLLFLWLWRIRGFQTFHQRHQLWKTCAIRLQQCAWEAGWEWLWTRLRSSNCLKHSNLVQ